MKSIFHIFAGKDNQYYFNLKAGNNQIILQSEGYTSKQGALTGIKSVQENCTEDSNYDRRIAKDDSPYFVLKAQNGEIIGTSEMYSSNQMMENGIDSVKSNGSTTDIDDSTSKTTNIHINKTKYKVEEDSMTGSELLALAGFSSSTHCLFLLEGNKQIEIKSNESVSLKNGMRFQAIVNDIKFG